MGPIRAVIGTLLAFAGAALASQDSTAAAAMAAPAETQAGFFTLPAHPVAYSFMDICSLTIEPEPRSPCADARTTAGSDLLSAWAARSGPPSTAEAADKSAAVEAKPVAGRFFSMASVPEPSEWMRLCGFAIVFLIAKRRRDWSSLRGLALGSPLPLRRPHADPEATG